MKKIEEESVPKKGAGNLLFVFFGARSIETSELGKDVCCEIIPGGISNERGRPYRMNNSRTVAQEVVNNQKQLMQAGKESKRAREDSQDLLMFRVACKTLALLTVRKLIMLSTSTEQGLQNEL